MDTSWIRHAKDPDERKKIKDGILNSKYTLDLLITILKRELDEIENTSKEDYSIPNWDCYQADQNGYKRAIKRFLNLINLKE